MNVNSNFFEKIYCIKNKPVLYYFLRVNAPLAQLVEHLTLNQGVQGSNPWRCTEGPNLTFKCVGLGLFYCPKFVKLFTLVLINMKYVSEADMHFAVRMLVAFLKRLPFHFPWLRFFKYFGKIMNVGAKPSYVLVAQQDRAFAS